MLALGVVVYAVAWVFGSRPLYPVAAGLVLATVLAWASVRLATDQTLENGTGVGAPPWTWPRQERVLDLVHKAVYALVTGALADALVPLPADRNAAGRAVRARRR